VALTLIQFPGPIVAHLRATDPVEEIMRLTDGRGVDVAIETLATQAPA